MKLSALLFFLCLLVVPLAACAAPRIPPLPPPVPPGVQVRLPVVTPAMHRYSQTGYALYFIGTAYSLLVLWGVLASGLSARLGVMAQRVWRGVRPWAWLPARQARRRLSPAWRRRFVFTWYGPCALYRHGPRRFRRLATVLTFTALLSLVTLVLNAPLIFYGGFWLDHAYGLSHQSFGGWLGDEAKDRVLTVLERAALLWLLFGLIRRSPRRWALWLWGAMIPLIAFGIFLAPLAFDPLFNTFTPLPPGPLRTQIQALEVKAGIPDAPILVADKSRQTDTTNAYVTGIGSSARIVLWDTLLRGRNKMPDDQTLSVVGHEMGHYVLGHLYRGFTEAVLGLIFALPLLQVSVQWLVRRYGHLWRVGGLTDPAAIPMFLLVFSVISFLADPITNALSRQIEHEADAYGIAITQNRVAMARAFVALSEQNLDEPDPPAFIKFWLFSHPPLGERIAFALGRKTGVDGETLGREAKTIPTPDRRTH